MARVTQITKEEMEPVVTARAKALEAASVAERALKDARLAELEFKVQIQQMYLAKGLDPNCKVDISTGTITWPDEADQQEGETDDKPAKKVSRLRGKSSTGKTVDVEAEKSEAEAK
jgi:hypothetical protein